MDMDMGTDMDIYYYWTSVLGCTKVCNYVYINIEMMYIYKL